MEATETNLDGSIESAVESIVAPIEETKEEVTSEAEVTAESETEEDVVANAESESEEETAQADSESSDESDEEVGDEEIEASTDNNEEVDDDNAVQDEPSDTYTVKVNGENQEVTLDELKQSYSGNKYVQEGMREVAGHKKQVEEVYTNLLNERKQVAELLAQVQQGGLPSAPVAPSEELFNQDPIGYMEAKMKFDKDMGEYNAKVGEMQKVAEQNSEAEARAKRAYMTHEMDALKKAIPEFADANKASKIKDNLVRTGQDHYGYSAEEIGQVMDHRALKVLHDAMKYREIMEGKAKAVAKTKKAKPMVKPGAKKVQNSQAKARQKQKAKLRQTGDINDALGLLLET